MEKKNGKQVVRIGVVGEHEDQNKQFITAIVSVIAGRDKAYALDFGVSPSTIHDTFKVAYKEIDVETQKYYYKFIFYPNFIPAIQHDQSLIEKSLMTGAGKPDLFVSVVYGEMGRSDAQYIYDISKLRIPLSGVFIHYDKPEPGEEEMDIEMLEYGVKEVIEEHRFFNETQNYQFSDLKWAISGGDRDRDWAAPVKDFVDELDRTIASYLDSAKEDRRSNGPKNTNQIQTLVYLPCKEEGYDKPLEDGQEVNLEFESKKLKGKPYEHGNAGGQFEDVRKSYARQGVVKGIGFNFDKKEKIGIGDRFFIKVNGRIDGVGFVAEITYS